MKTSALYELLVNEWVSKVICCADEEDEFGFKKIIKKHGKNSKSHSTKTERNF